METFEYIEVVSDSARIPYMMDSYECFGWEVTEQTKLMQEKKNGKHLSREKLGLRRNRHLPNKVELTRLQRNFEAYAKEIDQLQEKKSGKARLAACVLAFLGCVFLTCGVFAVVASPPDFVLSAILAVPGFLGWILPFPVYRMIKEKESERIDPLIVQKMDEMDLLCKKAKKLL